MLYLKDLRKQNNFKKQNIIGKVMYFNTSLFYFKTYAEELIQE